MLLSIAECCGLVYCDRRDERTWLLALNLVADLNNMTPSCMPCRTVHVSIRCCDSRAEQSRASSEVVNIPASQSL
jgi:hypothetical protein